MNRSEVVVLLPKGGISRVNLGSKFLLSFGKYFVSTEDAKHSINEMFGEVEEDSRFFNSYSHPAINVQLGFYSMDGPLEEVQFVYVMQAAGIKTRSINQVVWLSQQAGLDLWRNL